VTKKAIIDDFLSQKKLAVVGVSRSGGKFGNLAYRELKRSGFDLIPIHPQAGTLEGDKTCRDLASLPVRVGALLIMVPPTQTEKVVQEARKAGIKRIWMQQGSESQTAIDYCNENGIAEVHGECILMFAGKSFLHKPHRWLWGLLGRLPK
jgi:predicted CoA-binding protein